MVGHMKRLAMTLTLTTALALTACDLPDTTTTQSTPDAAEEAPEETTAPDNADDDVAEDEEPAPTEDEDTDDAADDEEPELDTPDQLATQLAERHDNVDVYLDDQTGDLSVTVDTPGTKNWDQVYTAETLELIGHHATFDYDTVTITGRTDAGIWAYRYDTETIDKFVERGIIIPNVWDHAENSTDRIH